MPPPSAPTSKGGPRPPARRGPQFAPRRFNVLSAALAGSLATEELTQRMQLLFDEGNARSGILVQVVNNLIAEKIHAAVARHWFSTLTSRDYVLSTEQAEFDRIGQLHRAQLTNLRRNVPLEVVNRMIQATRDGEEQSRRTIVLLERKMFNEFFEFLAAVILQEGDTDDGDMAVVAAERAAARRRNFGAAAASRPASAAAIPRAALRIGEWGEGGQRPPKRRTTVGPNGEPLVHLCDGCPFINPNDCPFYGSPWISKESFSDQHMRRKLPRLKRPIKLEQLSYEKLLREREEYVNKVNVRMLSLN